MPLFFIYFSFFIPYIHSLYHNTFIRRHSLKPLSISSSLVCSVGETSLWGRAENRTRACLTASRRAANCATPPHICLQFSLAKNPDLKLSSIPSRFSLAKSHDLKFSSIPLRFFLAKSHDLKFSSIPLRFSLAKSQNLEFSKDCI
jgi:hypothetical protein